MKEMGCLCQGRNGQRSTEHVQNLYRTSQGQSFPREKILRVGIGQMSISHLEQCRDWLDFMLSSWQISSLGISRFCAQLVKGRVCFFGSCFRDKVCSSTGPIKLFEFGFRVRCFFHWPWIQEQSVFLHLNFRVRIYFFVSSFRVKIMCLTGSSFRVRMCFFGWPIYHTQWAS